MRVRVLGAGIIGLSLADELLQRGHHVTIVDPSPGRGASHAAAGMLSPSAEVWHGEAEILRLGMRSLALWPAYAERLGVPLHRTGTLLVARDRGDLQQVERQVELLQGLGASLDVLSGRQVCALEPTVGSRVAGGALLPDDHSVDPRALVAALRRTLRGRSCDVAAPTTISQDVLSVAGSFDATVIATGASLPEPWSHLIRGVRGEILRGRTDDPPQRTVRGWACGRPVYVVPRTDGGIVVGATSEEHDAPPEVTFGGMFGLIEAARELLPGLDQATFTEALARDRPATRDHLPLVGPAPGGDGVVLAAGFFRHGVLLAPLAAQMVADYLECGHLEPALDPRRFDTSQAITEGNRC